MPWFKVDDQFHDHRKAARAGAGAVGLWTLAGSWCADNLTDGFIPEYVVVRWDRQWKRLAQRLVDARLWEPGERDGEPGWFFHEWTERQPTRAEVEADRESARDRMALRRAKQRAEKRAELDRQIEEAESQGIPVRSARVRPNVRANNERSSGRSSPPVLGPNPTRPDPTRPDQLTTPPAGTAAPPSAQTLVGEWVDACGERPPDRIVGQVAREVGKLLDERIPYADVRNGLRSWHAKRLHPATIASEVHAVRLGPPEASAKPSTTDQRVGAALDLAAQLREAEQAGQTPAIGA